MFPAGQFGSEAGMVSIGLPGHGGDLGGRPEVRLGVAMAVEAPPHAQRLTLCHHHHTGDVAMAAETSNTCREMGAVVKVGVIRQ